ncbi:RagB/SusD family nutrient uptake outer membrane protein [Chitinophaga caeni]|uniref:RagB/SusD family nutrient uptake outer membrane protein n=1 Tax=Chitinophaga caeni TaxID=2029983 RepID=A0A291QPN3_9BACT|nr:RagB/SusD family nutrient uptake outer membrane protein [Chitinophaga caeni]ATL45896.1 RagB/SusD family nutrient uptake outer membrane protein [Chitinophaga caeni]
MKKIFIIFTVALVTGITSCSKYLDQVPDDVITIEDIFKSKVNIDKFLANIYASLPNENTERYTNVQHSGVFTGAADEAVYNWSFPYSTQLNSSTWAKTDGNIASWWNDYYKAIRNASYFLQEIEAVPINQAGKLTQEEKNSYKAEARALRAMFYYFLVRTYGPVPIVGETPLDLNTPLSDLQLKRDHIDTCINYIVSELDAAAEVLSTAPLNGEIGRITKGACKAFKVEALLLAASPLWNGNTDYADFKNVDGTDLVNTTYSEAKWQRAATAAKEFINEFDGPVYNLFTIDDADPFKAAYLSCRELHLRDWNAEWIFARARSGQYQRYDRTPRHIGASADFQGGGALGATQTQVDAYFMANGLPITDPASGYQNSGFTSFKAPYDPSSRSTYNQWINREPRFYADITYNNSFWWYSSNVITNMEYDGNSGRKQSTSDVSPTGYIPRKAVQGSGFDWGALYIRLGTIYLDYVEALNEADPTNPDILTYLNAIRHRAGIPGYGEGIVPVPAGKEAMRAAIRAERRVELAFERVRFFDTRRWKIAENTNNAPIMGMNMNANGEDFYTPTIIQQRVFRKDRDYLFPIPNDETLLNLNLAQNPGW